jgi:hypothetical protein
MGQEHLQECRQKGDQLSLQVKPKTKKIQNFIVGVMDINGKEMNSNIEMSTEITSFMMHEIWPSSTGHFLLLS